MSSSSSTSVAEMPDPAKKDAASLTWDEFREMSPREKGLYMRTDAGDLQMVLYSQQFDRTLLDRLCRVAELIRTSKPDGDVRRHLKTLLATRSGALYFGPSRPSRSPRARSG
jgi:hypothetical protein